MIPTDETEATENAHVAQPTKVWLNYQRGRIAI
jgi:hypothetical protein